MFRNVNTGDFSNVKENFLVDKDSAVEKKKRKLWKVSWFFYLRVLNFFFLRFSSELKWGCKKNPTVHILNWKKINKNKTKTPSMPWGWKITFVSVLKHPSIWRICSSTSYPSLSCCEMQMPIRDILMLVGRNPSFWVRSPAFHRLPSFPASQHASLCIVLLCAFRFYLTVSQTWLGSRKHSRDCYGGHDKMSSLLFCGSLCACPLCHCKLGY